MKRLYTLLIFCALLGCGGEDGSTSPETSLKLLTGINLRQSSDDVSLQLGNPNILTENRFVAYPNPANEVISVSAEDNISQVWIVRANAQKKYQDTDFGSILSAGFYSGSELTDKSVFELNNLAAQDLSLDISNLPKGYYRIFVEIDGLIYWDNIYKAANEGHGEEEIAEMMAFWN